MPLGAVISNIIDILSIVLLPILAAIALLVFFVGLVKFLAKSGDAKTHSEGRNLMIWGVIALFVMVSFLGIIFFFQRDLGFFRGGVIPRLPQ